MDARRSDRAAKYNGAVVETDDSDSDSSAVSRPKLRTRRVFSYASENDMEDEDEGAVTRNSNSTAAAKTASTRTSRKRKSVTADEEEDYQPQTEEQMLEEEEADDLLDDEEDEVSSTEDIEEEEDDSNRRRSSRVRKPVKPALEFPGIDVDFDDSLEYFPNKSRRDAKSSKKPFSASRGSKSKGKRKSKSSLSSRKAKSSNGSDSENDDFLMSDDDNEPSGSRRDDSDDNENMFVIDKLIAREVHTLKEWNKICAGKTTRFLQNMSIFLEDDDDDVEDVMEQNKKTEQKADATEQNKKEEKAAAETKETPSATEQSKDPDVVMEDRSSSTPAPLEPTTPTRPTAGKSASTPINVNEVSETQERFLVKWKGLSYLHVSWENEKSLLEVDKNAKGKIQRFRDKELMGLLNGDLYGDEYFSPEFRIVDRILDIQDRPGDEFSAVDSDEKEAEKHLRYFYVKWKSLPYDAVTWEREDDVDDDAAVRIYEDRLIRAAARHRRVVSSSNRKSRKISTFRAYSAKDPPPFKEDNNFELRDYQLLGVNWMLFNWYQNRNSLLADEMGLGKTVQTVTYINHLAVVEELPGPYLIIAPLSTLGHWQREFTTWTNLDAVVYHGSAEARKKLYEYEFFLNDYEYSRAEELMAKRDRTYRPQKNAAAKSKRDQYRFDVLITTPEMCGTTDFSKLTRVNWQVLVVDEAHRLKNKSSKLSSLIHKNFKYDRILLLTGTPLQNNVEELWTLLNFLDQERFSSMEAFLENFGNLRDVAQVEQLHSELKPFLLRRMKEDVEKSLAPKEETIVEVELTVLQKQYYRAIFEQNTEFLARGRKKAQTPSLMNVAMELRKCCNHPFLIKGVEEQEIIRIQQQKGETQEELDRQAQEVLVNSSGKLVLLDKLLPRLKENGHRVLIFSQFKIMLDILQDYLRLRAYHCERIDGDITGNDRQAAIDRYCDPNSASFIMLLSTRAGGVGINLTAADTVIIYDSDWNPQNDLQAQARCHRIGQKKSVKIYRLLTSKTYELHMFHQASLKLGLDQAVLGGIRSKETAGALLPTSSKGRSKSNGPSKEEIESLLKHGAYEIFKEEKEGEAEAASKRFSEESIDQILSRSTKIVHDPKANDGEDGKKSLMSSFSKATFVSSTNPDEQVALDDPDFWTKVIGLKEVEEKPVEPSPLKKRRRRPVKSYVLDDSGDEQGFSRKSSKKSRGFHQEKDNEEYVISDEDDDDDDDDDDDTLDEDDFESIAAKKKAKEKQKQVPPISLYTERIADMLTTYGYGRWDDMITNYPVLHQYPVPEIKKYTQQFVAYSIRLAAGATADATTMVTSAGNGEAPQPMSSEHKESMIDGFAARFHFTTSVLRDMNLERMSLVVMPKSLRGRPTSLKGQREANQRLVQIDRMYQVQKIIRSKIGTPSPIVSLINDLQQLADRAQIRQILETGKLPDHLLQPGKANEGNESSSSSPGAKASETEIGKDEPTESTTTVGSNDNAATPSADAAKEASPTATTAPTDDDAAATTAASEGGDTGAISETTDTTGADSSQTQADSGESLPSATDGESNAPPPAAETIPEQQQQQDTATSNSSTATKPEDPQMSADDAAKERAERLEALRRLQALPDIGIAESVAPWWISVIDDVILLFYVYKDGWFKGRQLPNQLITQSSLFGSRAKAVEPTLWPTVALLTKRAKALIAAWTNERILRKHELTLAQMNPKPFFPPPEVTSASSSSSRAPSLSTTPSNNYNSSRAALQQHRTTCAASSTFSTSKHNRFAKIVFAFGIPDVRTCRDEQERLEKWRYFLQDPHLALVGHALVELLAEALDLERCCRLRVQNSVDASQANHAMANSSSILGGKRGFWLLTSTQCRRLLQRVDLFRLLRTQILVLPPNQLVEVVGRVVKSLRSDPLNNDFPRWWSSPRHDILLLQGVECYGLDEYLSHVWKLPLFALANPSGSFPNTTWVENYVTALALRCRRVISASAINQRSATSAAASVSSPPKEPTEVRQRIRDIQGMRSEDPYFTPAVRLRQLIESNAAADWKKPNAARQESSSPRRTSTENAATANEEAKEKDAPSPSAARPMDVEAESQRADDANAGTTSSGRKRGRTSDESDDEALQERQQRDKSPAIRPDRPGSSSSSSRTSKARGITATRAVLPRAAASQQQRTPRPWDVIVIDESSDDE